MPAFPPLSNASGLVLRDLAGADGKEIIKQAIKELVARGAFALERDEVPRKLRRPRTRLLLVPAASPHPGDTVLFWVDRAIRSAPSETDGVRRVHDLAAVARAMAKDDPKVAKHVVELALADLEQRRLVGSEERRRAGLFHRTVWTRTP